MYAMITDEKTKAVSVGLGTDIEFYKSIGMTDMEVEQDYYGNWYIKGYAPDFSEQIKQDKISELDAQYLADKAQLMQYFFEFSIADNTEGMEAIKAELEALNQQYDNDLAEIEKGVKIC